MNRYTCISTVLLLVLLVPATQAQHPLASKKPNIILFIADDLATEDTGPYGNEEVRTPNLDRLSGESLLFRSAFASSPTCGPSRSSVFTGLLPFRHGAHSNHSGVREGTRSLVHYLQPLGYRVAIAGKYHVGPEALFPFERVSNTNVPEPGFEKNPGLHYDLNMVPVDQWLSAQKTDKPFMLVVADHSPHVIWPEDAEYDPETINIPARHIDTEATRRARARYYADITKMDRNLGKLLESITRHGLADNTVVLFTSDQGPQWAFGKWSLYDYGIQVPLLVRWPGHLKGVSETNALVSLVDLLPTFIEMAGGEPAPGLDGKSFLPLLKDNQQEHREVVFASHTGDGNMNRSPARMLRTKRYKYILNLAPEILYTTHMDRSKNHKGGQEYWDSWRVRSFNDAHAAAVLWRYHNRPKEELYDVEADPQERHNLAADPRYTEMLHDFRVQLASWRKQQGDEETGPEDLSKKTEQQKAHRQKPVAPYVFLD